MDDIVFSHIESEDDERIYDIPYHYEDKTKIFVINEAKKEEIRKRLTQAR